VTGGSAALRLPQIVQGVRALSEKIKNVEQDYGRAGLLLLLLL
jgi:hypothetical protein